MRLPVFYALKRIANYDFLLFLMGLPACWITIDKVGLI